MAKKIKLWIGESDNGMCSKKRTLKALCEGIGLSYSTAKKGQDKTGGKKKWLIGGKVWTVWVEYID